MANQDPMETSRSPGDDLDVQLRWGGAEGTDWSRAIPGGNGARPSSSAAPAHMIRAGDDDDPQLRLVHDALTELRAELADLRAALSSPARPASGGSPAGDDAVLTELAALRADLVALKRRLAVRAAGTTERDAEQAELIARLVAERLAVPPGQRDTT